MSAAISVLSTVYVKARITAQKNGVYYDPTADLVEVAFVGPGVTPVPADWHVASWETAGTTVHYARLLVGPAGLVLPTGTYVMWIRVTDAPEIPVLPAPGNLRVF